MVNFATGDCLSFEYEEKLDRSKTSYGNKIKNFDINSHSIHTHHSDRSELIRIIKRIE
ncbi:hypothetical protein GLOIN_2v1604322 [Rhizophagus irregularis DAOM 181602=DAOM 197198]|uniref:Uncharacterized protein n=2 Tax=Rhizophagus irregularis TaxID=588596 RepID=A0A2N1NMG9_9GLOM|nr:hypothetical protein GLOIN_2v1604322 [Rhizophagus irregularis DAOM 181602=DAOM 197198]PKK75068.1 hypothetical protein RhiirC2_737417 [Rhizophagus irregularis]POG71617.1 hypothetical protein GLOIN_2v1604322 [Rhizophagus irregularis DAOM 181602=DAOM 197198]GET54848.1 hypothetical protein GLOIN_2v1604322 [Rhizophagus irregularis DAOM 181602=DAOM 197198]|eukprot:XP_025178483.1 hypothetical protein GLOIN_2v1604322 [Rhizophagus irregularis DAOM 181602=DAOM 197198]